ncbi:MAG: hypothetical protein AB8B93_15705 [Pseudomonadales bacterium]
MNGCKRCLAAVLFLSLLTLGSANASAQAQSEPAEPALESSETSADATAGPSLEAPEMAPPVLSDDAVTLVTIRSLMSLRNELRSDIAALNERLMDAQTSGDKQRFAEQIEKLSIDLQATRRNLQEVAAGSDLATLRVVDDTAFDVQQEFFSLLEPAIREMKDLTSHVRAKSEQRERIAYFDEKLPVTETAIENLTELLTKAEDPQLVATLTEMLDAWRKQDTFLRTERQSAALQLRKLESTEASLADASQSYLKRFFQTRGRYLGIAVLLALAVVLVMRLVRKALERLVPGHQQQHRSFQVRLLDLSQRLLTGILLIVVPMLVFYMVEDWLLFSLGILLLLGIALGLRHAIPRYWQVVQLFLNVGTVREGERVELHGLPWRVQRLHLYTKLDNPTTGLQQRVKIDDLVDMRSRPVAASEPWFPCQRGDWVIMADNFRGRVTGLSQELVQLVARGGAHKSYTMAAFLGGAPLNLATNFRIKVSIGVSYDLQRQAPVEIPELLRAFVERRLGEEGYADALLNLRVEFEAASSSSLDLVVITDFKGELGDLYNRLRRMVARICVEACSEYDWEIPFDQLTVHQA